MHLTGNISHHHVSPTFVCPSLLACQAFDSEVHGAGCVVSFSDRIPSSVAYEPVGAYEGPCG